MLVDAGDGEEAENRGDDEHVVHRQGLLEQIAGVEFETGFGAALPPHPATKGQGNGDVETVKREAFPGADLMLVLVQNAEIENQKCNDDRDERDPEIDGSTQKIAR